MLTWKNDKTLIKTIIFAILFVPVLFYAHWDMFNHFGWCWKYTAPVIERFLYGWKYLLYLLIVGIAYYISIWRD